jgi:hypothetical protein
MFDPNYPPLNADLLSEPMRAQFNGLKALIDAVPTLNAAQVDSTNTLPQGTPANANVSLIGNTLHFSFDLPQGAEGTQGMMGAQGPPFANAVVDGVNTVGANTPAAVGVSFDGSNVRFTFDIPRGFDGPQGIDGPSGGDGPAGQPFAQAVVDAVSTLDPGQPATVGVNFDGGNVRFTFGIPRGNDGSNGNDGTPGEVTNADLSSAISGTSNNSNGVGTLDAGFTDPDLETLRQAYNNLVLSLRR